MAEKLRILKETRKLVKEYPNDMELGDKVRQLYGTHFGKKLYEDMGDGHLVMVDDAGVDIKTGKYVMGNTTNHEYGLGNDGHYERYGDTPHKLTDENK